ncbi:hypothetical protein AeNC1_013489, partial [Aphanomyces euteiches]
KWSKEKEDRRMEKEWMADIWPDFVVVPPTILKPFMKELHEEEKQKRSQAEGMKTRLNEEALRVQECMAHAKQWTFVDNYYYNATTGLGYREKSVEDGVVLALTVDFQSSPPNNNVDTKVVVTRSDSGGSDGAVDDQLDSIES